MTHTKTNQCVPPSQLPFSPLEAVGPSYSFREGCLRKGHSALVCQIGTFSMR